MKSFSLRSLLPVTSWALAASVGVISQALPAQSQIINPTNEVILNGYIYSIGAKRYTWSELYNASKNAGEMPWTDYTGGGALTFAQLYRPDGNFLASLNPDRLLSFNNANDTDGIAINYRSPGGANNSFMYSYSSEKQLFTYVVNKVAVPTEAAEIIGDLGLSFNLSCGTSRSALRSCLRKVVFSGIAPRNIDAPGIALSSYNNLLADTIFERVPMRKFVKVGPKAETPEPEPTPSEPIRGLWKTSPTGEVIEVNGEAYAEIEELTAELQEEPGMNAWVRGFGGSSNAQYTNQYTFNNWSATNGGVVAGVDYNFNTTTKLGLYANYGSINLDQGGQWGGGSWTPTGWGGGVQASYWADNFFVQGLFGASGFSGDQDRNIVAIGRYTGDQVSGEKDVTSLVGSLRVGAPLDLGSVILEPQATATWSGNQENAFSESGSNVRVFNLRYSSRDTSFWNSTVGLKAYFPIKQGERNLLTPTLRAAWLGNWDTNNSGQTISVTSRRRITRSTTIESNQQDKNGVLLEAGIDYSINNLDTTSWKLYAKGGVEIWDNANNNTDWRTSGGITFVF